MGITFFAGPGQWRQLIQLPFVQSCKITFSRSDFVSAVADSMELRATQRVVPRCERKLTEVMGHTASVGEALAQGQAGPSSSSALFAMKPKVSLL